MSGARSGLIVDDLETGECMLSVRTVRWIMATYLLLFMLATTWPGASLFNAVRPLVFGLPFNLFFIALLIVIALVLLAALYTSEQRSGD
ncbi:MAG: hypothetical protein AAGK01_00510 [Pseudomonadota bacterium]